MARPLMGAVRLVLRAPRATVVLAVALAVAAVGLSLTSLGFRTSRLDLLNPNSPYNRLWLEHVERFGERDDVIVVVEGRGRDEVVPVLAEIAAALEREPDRFQAVLYQVDLDRLRAKGLHYLPLSQLRAIDGFLASVEPVYRGQWAQLSVGNMVAQLAAQQSMGGPAGAMAEEQLARVVRSLHESLAPGAGLHSPWPELADQPAAPMGLSDPCLVAADGRMGMVLLQLVPSDTTQLAQNSEAIDALRQLAAAHQRRHPEVRIGVTGLPVMENDEMRSSSASMLVASLFSIVGVVVLYMAGLGGLRHPLLAGVVLLLSMAWTFGYTTLVVGHLNILSIAFGAILIGLGIDYSIHVIARYLQMRSEGQEAEEALLGAAAAVGPGIVTGAVSTAVAFFMAALTEFTGIVELGIIAGGGVFFCLGGSLLVLPALILLADGRRAATAALPTPLDLTPLVRPLASRPRLTMALTLAAVLMLGVGTSELWFDHNLLHLQPRGLESVALEKKLLAEADRSVWYAISTSANREELLARKEQFLKLPSVERVDEIVSLVVPDAPAKRPIIENIRRRLADLGQGPPQIPVDAPQQLLPLLEQLRAMLARSPNAAPLCSEFDRLAAALAALPLPECTRLLAEYQQHAADDLLRRLAELESVSNPEPPALADLPESVLARFVGRDGSHLLRVYSRGSIWDMAAMDAFVRDVRSVDPRATGSPLQTYEASRQLKRSYEQAAWYALAVIVAFLYLDFGSVRHALLAMLPVAAAAVMMFGLMGWMDMPLNPANMIALPLILGLGVDNGVHIVHEFIRQRGPYRLGVATANALALCSLTTMVGFGTMMLADHRGLQSIGRVLTIGMGMVMIGSLAALPALLGWLSRHRGEIDDAIPTPILTLEHRGPRSDEAESSSATSLPYDPQRRRLSPLVDPPSEEQQRAA